MNAMLSASPMSFVLIYDPRPQDIAYVNWCLSQRRIHSSFVDCRLRSLIWDQSASRSFADESISETHVNSFSDAIQRHGDKPSHSKYPGGIRFMGT